VLERALDRPPAVGLASVETPDCIRSRSASGTLGSGLSFPEERPAPSGRGRRAQTGHVQTGHAQTGHAQTPRPDRPRPGRRLRRSGRITLTCAGPLG
jgi:hypothetical protein